MTTDAEPVAVLDRIYQVGQAGTSFFIGVQEKEKNESNKLIKTLQEHIDLNFR